MSNPQEQQIENPYQSASKIYNSNHLESISHEQEEQFLTPLDGIKKKIFKRKYKPTIIDKAISLNKRYKCVRKLTQKSLKVLKIKVSTFSKEIDEQKSTIKDWFKRKIEDETDKQRISEKAKNWLIQNIVLHRNFLIYYQTTVDYKKFFQIAQKYIREEEFELNMNICKQNPYAQFQEINSSIVYCNQPRMQRQKWGRNYIIRENIYPDNLTAITLKIPLRFLVEDEHVYLKETFLWDLDDNQTEDNLFTNTFLLVHDVLHEKYPLQLKNVTIDQMTVIAMIKICVLQIKVNLEWHRRIKASWGNLLEMENGINKNVSIDNLVNIKIEIKNVYSETIQWDLSNQLKCIDEFANQLVIDLQLPSKYNSFIGIQMRKQIFKILKKRLDSLAKYFQIIINNQQSLNEATTQNDLRSKVYLLLKEQIGFDFFNGFNQQEKESFSTSDMMMYFRRNIEYLPNELQNFFGIRNNLNYNIKQETNFYSQLIRKQALIDSDDIRKNEKKYTLKLQANKYMDPQILAEIERQNTNLKK